MLLCCSAIELLVALKFESPIISLHIPESTVSDYTRIDLQRQELLWVKINDTLKRNSSKNRISFFLFCKWFQNMNHAHFETKDTLYIVNTMKNVFLANDCK